jgi:hypothetical protein
MSKSSESTPSHPGPVPAPPPNRRSSFSQNPSFQTLFGRGSPPRPTAPDPALQRRFSWSFAPPAPNTQGANCAIDDSDEITSPTDESQRRPSDYGRRISTTASSIKDALGMGYKSTSPGTMQPVRTFVLLANCRVRSSNKESKVNRMCPHRLVLKVPHPRSRVNEQWTQKWVPNHSCSADEPVLAKLEMKAIRTRIECSAAISWTK